MPRPKTWNADQERKRIHGLTETEAKVMLRRVHTILYPVGDPNAAWSPDTLDAIAAVFTTWLERPEDFR